MLGNVVGWFGSRIRRKAAASSVETQAIRTTSKALARMPATLLHTLLDLTCTIKVVDIGANPIDGEPPYSRMMANGCTHVVGFEPNLKALAVLRQRAGPNEIYLPNALGDGRRHILHYCAAPGMTSLLEPNPSVLALFPGFPEWGRVVRTEEIDTLRLDDVGETESLDLLKLDIQGSELMVLQGAVGRLANALIVQTEVEFLQMYLGQPLFADVDSFLREHGFVLHKFAPLVSRVLTPMLVDNNLYAGLSQLAWGDAIYVKDITRLDRYGPDQLLRSATILHDCYRSYDLVLKLLQEYDRRTGNTLAKRYIQHLGGNRSRP